MKRHALMLLCCLATMATPAQVRDVFQDILPVTDPSMQKSLNGEWQLKVTEGIAEDTDVPAPFHPFEKQYDTYLMRLKDIVE